MLILYLKEILTPIQYEVKLPAEKLKGEGPNRMVVEEETTSNRKIVRYKSKES